MHVNSHTNACSAVHTWEVNTNARDQHPTFRTEPYTSSASVHARCVPDPANICTPSTREDNLIKKPRRALQALGAGDMLSSSATAQQESGQQPGAGEDTMSVDALYKLIGAAKGERQSTLSSEQQAHVSRVQQEQLKQAAAAEAATVGAWLAPPRQQRCAAAADDSCDSSSCMRPGASQQAVSDAEQPGALEDAAADATGMEDDRWALQAATSNTCNAHVTAQAIIGKQHTAKQQKMCAFDAEEVAGTTKQQGPGLRKDTWQEAESVSSQRQSAGGAMQRSIRASCSSTGGASTTESIACTSSEGSGAPGVVAAAAAGRGTGQGQGSNGALLRARHSTILHVAMMKAAAAADSLEAA